MNIFIEYGKDVIQLPVNPEEIKVTTEGNNEIVEVVKLGEVNILKDTKLPSLQLTSFFPEVNDFASYILTKDTFRKPEFYINFIEKIRQERKPCRFIVSESNMNYMVSIESFEYGYEGGDHDVYYTLSLKGYRKYKARQVQISDYQSTRSTYTAPEPRVEPVIKKVTPGCDVIVNGRLHRDSYGAGPGMTLSNYRGKINFVNTNAYPYHVTNTSGGWLGWVLASCVEVV